MYRYIKIFSFIAVAAIASLFGCKKDLGNYSYHAINQASISGIDTLYTAIQGGHISINPVLKFTMDDSNDTSRYSYEWFSLDVSTTPIGRKTLAITRNLDYTVALLAKDIAYQLFYQVTEKSTGKSWIASTNLKVSTDLADGWAVLNDVNGVARLDYLNYLSAKDSFYHYTDILSSQQSIVLKGKPVNLSFWYRRNAFTAAYSKALVVSTDQQTTFFNTSNNKFTDYTDISKNVSTYNPPPYYATKFQTSGRVDYICFMLDNLGNLSFENATQGSPFGNRVNKLADATPFTISKWFVSETQQTPNYTLMYDVDKKRFMEHRSTNSSSSIAANTNADPNGTPLFDPAHMNMDLMYMTYTAAIDGRIYAVFKDAAGAVFLARIKAGNTTFIPLSFDKISDLAPNIGTATHFAVDPLEGYLFYVVGSKVYRYTPDRKTNVMVADYGDKTISLMKFQKVVYSTANERYKTYATKLMVCSYNATTPAASGKMDLYNVPNLDGDLSIYKSFTGFDKIVSVTYRE